MAPMIGILLPINMRIPIEPGVLCNYILVGWWLMRTRLHKALTASDEEPSAAVSSIASRVKANPRVLGNPFLQGV